MNNDLKPLIEKLKAAVVHRTKVELATALNFNEANSLTLVGADSRVDSATATLMAALKSAQRQQNMHVTAPHSDPGRVSL